jgi:3-oxoacyl-[acyl-carrier-protein] synthase III
LLAWCGTKANKRIVDALVRSIRLPDTVVVANDITETGNTSAASVPLALSQLVARGQVASGDLALLLAFGAGLTYAGQVVRVP